MPLGTDPDFATMVPTPWFILAERVQGMPADWDSGGQHRSNQGQGLVGCQGAAPLSPGSLWDVGLELAASFYNLPGTLPLTMLQSGFQI
jgi:hypothetical protein